MKSLESPGLSATEKASQPLQTVDPSSPLTDHPWGRLGKVTVRFLPRVSTLSLDALAVSRGDAAPARTMTAAPPTSTPSPLQPVPLAAAVSTYMWTPAALASSCNAAGGNGAEENTARWSPKSTHTADANPPLLYLIKYSVVRSSECQCNE